MDKKKRIVSVIAGILVVAMAIGFLASIAPVFAGAVSSAEIGSLKTEVQALKDKRQEIAGQISALESKISANASEMEEIAEQKSVLEQQIGLLLEQISATNDQIEAYGVMIEEKQKELVDAQTRLAELNEKNKERIRAMEENGKMSYWSVLFQANSFSDLLDRINMVEEIADSDQRRLAEMNEAAVAVETAKKELEEEKKGLESTKAELEASQKELDAKQAEVQVALDKLVALGAEYEAMLMDASAKSDDLAQQQIQKEAQLSEAERKQREEELKRQEEEKKKQEEEQKRQEEANKPKPPVTPPVGGGGSGGNTQTSGGITWTVPISYTMVSSPFGWREHPIYHTQKLHAGIDLAAPRGTPIVASRSGVVTVASYEAGGAGYYVNIDHLDGYVTRYMHMTNFIVSPGQNVTAGQVIGYCGSTGASTGPHLHFGIYVNGVPQNPANYINF